MEVYSLSLLLSVKLLIWPSILIESLAGYSSLGCRPLVFITWNIFRHFLLAWSISIEKSAANLIRASLYVVSCFSLAAFEILSLSWNLASLIMMCLEVGLLGFLLLIGTLCFLYLCDFFSHQTGELFHYYYFFKQVFYPLLFSFSYPY